MGSKATLVLNTVTIEGSVEDVNTVTWGLSHPVIDSQAGKLELTKTTMKNMVMKDESLLEISTREGYFSMSSCTFSNIVK